MLTTIISSVLITVCAYTMYRFVQLLYKSCLDAEDEATTPPVVKTVAFSTRQLEGIIQSRHDTLKLIQDTDLRQQSFDMFPDEERKAFPESYHCAKEINSMAKQCYDDYDFENAAAFAQRASKEMQLAQREINQSV